MVPATTADLSDRAKQIKDRLDELDSQIETRPKLLFRSLKMAASSIAAVGGLLLAPPTGALSTSVALLGAWLWADSVREDVLLDHNRRDALVEQRRLQRELSEIGQELAARGL